MVNGQHGGSGENDTQGRKVESSVSLAWCDGDIGLVKQAHGRDREGRNAKTAGGPYGG